MPVFLHVFFPEMLVLQTRMTNKIIMALGYKVKHMLDLADRLEKT